MVEKISITCYNIKKEILPMSILDQNIYVKKIIQALPTNTVKYIFLVGSYAKDQNTNNSDVDFIVISDCFKNISGYLREKIVSANLANIYPRADIKCLTVREFEQYKCSDAYSNEVLKNIYEGK